MEHPGAPVDVNLTEAELKEIQSCVAKKLKGVAWVLENKEPEDRASLETRKLVQESILAKVARELPNEEEEE